MIHYLLTDSNGNVKQYGQCSNIKDLPVIAGLKSEIIEPNDPRISPKVEQYGYQDVRRMAYPTIGDQLDAIWELLSDPQVINAHPKVKAVFDRIQGVKTKFPKV